MPYRKARNWTRFPPDMPETSVIVGDERKSATILNESFGGIGVTIEMDDSVNVQVGDQLTVLHSDTQCRAGCSGFNGIRRPKVRLGIRWSS